jgi:hypothetical protein
LSRPANHKKPLTLEEVLRVLALPVEDPTDREQAATAAGMIKRRVGVANSIKRAAETFESGEKDQFGSPIVHQAMELLHALKANPHTDAPQWIKDIAQAYDPKLCARRWKIQ